MTVDNTEKDCFFCPRVIQPRESSSSEWVKDKKGKLVRIYMHNTCRFENHDELKRLAA
jgi:hypothetical protein